MWLVRSRAGWLLLSATLALVSGAPAHARSPAKVELTSVTAPRGPDADRLTRELRSMLTKAARKADFSGLKKVELSARIVEFSSVRDGDVQRVRCTLAGRVAGGAGAKSRIAFGGRPEEREKLEKQVLQTAAAGLVGRLAEIARAQAGREDAPPE